MKTWLNYTTFTRDLEWTRYSLESFKKYCTGFSGVTIVVPFWDVNKFLQFERYSTPECPVLIKDFLEYPSKGFVHHLAMKCYADVFSPKADFIMHMDPDCLFTEPQTPESYLKKWASSTCNNTGQEMSSWIPDLVVEPYEVLKTIHPARYHWKSVTEEALKFDVTHETMCRHPAVHHKWLYKAVREHIEAQHTTPFYDFVIKQKNQYPQGFGEFNTLGAYALKHHRYAYNVIDRGDKGAAADPKPLIKQLWSYTGVSAKDNMAEIKKILG